MIVKDNDIVYIGLFFETKNYSRDIFYSFPAQDNGYNPLIAMFSLVLLKKEKKYIISETLQKVPYITIQYIYFTQFNPG